MSRVSARGRASRTEAPDDELWFVERVVQQIRAQPEQFACPQDIAAHSGISNRALTALCLQHYHQSPAELLAGARATKAGAMLLSVAGSNAFIARTAGFPSVGEFKEALAAANGMSPDCYRALRLPAQNFRVSLPADYPLPWLRRALSRDPASLTDSLAGDRYTMAVHLMDGPIVVRMRISRRRVDVSLSRETTEAVRIHAMVVAILGLNQNTEGWIALARKAGLGRLVAHCPSLRVHQAPDLFDALLWTITGQQINLAFAWQLKRRLVMLAGAPTDSGLYAPPLPESVAALEPADLLSQKFSRQKADYLISISRLVASGGLDLEALRTMSATRVARTLIAVRGLGQWSVNYLMMRALGFADCLPLGDTGVTSALQSLFQMAQRPGESETRQLMAPLSPFRSFATAHLWQWGRRAPDGAPWNSCQP